MSTQTTENQEPKAPDYRDLENQLDDTSQNTPTDSMKMNIGYKILDIEKLIKKIKEIPSSPNPFSLYKKILDIRYDISTFMNAVTEDIVNGFKLNDGSAIVSLYYDSGYHEVLLKHMENYLYDSLYFDTKFYFEASIKFDEEKNILAKCLLKLYKKQTDNDILNFLKKYNKSEKTLENVKSIYKKLNFDNLKIDGKYLDENQSYTFLEKVYLNLDGELKKDFIGLFRLSIASDFKKVYYLYKKITESYIDKDSNHSKRAKNYVNMEEFKQLKEKIDISIIKYKSNKIGFYENINQIFSSHPEADKKIFFDYIRTMIINNYFPELKSTFYWEITKNIITDRLYWNSLASKIDKKDISQIINSKDKKTETLKKLLYLKEIIIQLNDNMWWTFMKPLIYNLIIEHLKTNEKDFNKVQFILCFVIAEDYSEYKKVYTFFNEIKIMYGLSDGKSNSNIINFLNKLKISASIIIFFVVVMVILFKTAPIMFFLSVLGIGIISFYEMFVNPYRSGIRWNTGLKVYFMIAASIFGFSWLINLGETLEDSQKVLSDLNKLNNITASQVITSENINKAMEYMYTNINYMYEKIFK